VDRTQDRFGIVIEIADIDDETALADFSAMAAVAASTVRAVDE
jgi:hypothetical protein